MSAKVDFKKAMREIYNPKIHGLHIIQLPKMNFLMVDGTGDPNLSDFYQHTVEALYAISYGIKFHYKSEGFDHVVPPLEGLWWTENMQEFTVANKYRWEWTMMIMQPEWVESECVQKIIGEVYKKKKITSETIVRFQSYEEGLAVQTLFIGAYNEEGPVIAQMHQFIQANGYQTNGKHHEIYLGDPRKVPAEKLLTILRQPILKNED